MKLYKPTISEEVANSISHGSMAALALICLPIGAVIGYTRGGVLECVGLSIFLVSIFLMLLASTLYHAMALDTRHKDIFHILDHIFIYVAIAGTYTPIALSVIGGWQGYLVVAIQWSMVLFGILYKSISQRRITTISLTIYLIMGWTIIFFFPLFMRGTSTALMVLIGAGGLAYTGGSIVYAKKGFKYHHLVWHLFINMGVICHAIALLVFL